MNKIVNTKIAIVFLLLAFQTKANENTGEISGNLILDDSWQRKIYLSYIKTLDKEYAVSNSLMVSSAEIDNRGNFKINLGKIPAHWSLLRLHVVKKGITPNSLVIGSVDENFMFLIAKRDSKIKLSNTRSKPIFKDVSITGANYMQTFSYVKKLSEYPNLIDYESSLVEREFIEAAVFEKLKIIADTCSNPLVSVYALSKTNFRTDYEKDKAYYENFLQRWKEEDNSYLKSFVGYLPKNKNNSAALTTYIWVLFCISTILLVGYYISIKKRKTTIKKLSAKEREIFDLLRKGMTNKEISAACNIELTTVKSHITSIYSKLKIKSRQEAINLKIN